MATELRRSQRWRSWYTAGVAGMASYLDACAIVTTGTALVLYQDSWGITGAQFGQLSALLTIMIAVGALVGGPLSDRFGRKRIFTLTIALYALGALFLVLAPGVGLLYLGIIFIGFGAGADLPPSLAMIAEAAPEGDEGKMVTFSHVLWMAGIVAAHVFGLFVGDLGAEGARIMYGHLLLVSLLVLILRWGLPESQLWTSRMNAVSSGSVDATSLRTVFSKRYLPALVAIGLFYGITNIAANTNGQFSTYLYVNVAGSDVRMAASMNLVGLGVGVLATFFLMRIVDSRYRMIGFALGTVAAVFAALVPALIGVTIITLVIFGLIYGIAGVISGEPLFKVWSQELFPTELRGTAQSIAISFTRFVAAGVGLVTPGIIEYGADVLFYFLGACLLTAGCIGFFWIARMPKVLQGEKEVGVHAPASVRGEAGASVN
ncbi:MFS transporter [Nesterenkonia cremea]|nr:MFS transporter [Nesterenkonia cremea]